MAEILVQSETAIDRGWAFLIRVATSVHSEAAGRAVGSGSEAGAEAGSEHTVRLSWADYDHWCHGRVAPERVAEAVIRFLLERGEGDGLRREFDAATIRRLHPEIDAELPPML